jgi:hypothetical protein
VTLVHVLRLNAGESAQTPHLPQHVAELRDAILTAARSGNIDELASALDMSSQLPDFGIADFNDPIAGLKAQSKDGKGHEFWRR